MNALFLLLAPAALAASAPAPVDPLTATVDDSAAQRFAAVWRASKGAPDAARLQSGYLANGGKALGVFTPDRIVNAAHLAAVIAHDPAVYGDAVERCLPWVAATNPELRATYLGLKGLLPRRRLPRIAVVFGANNSGGTAEPGIQVIGLEVVCRLAPTQAAFTGWMRQLFAHETVHTFQAPLSPLARRDPLLAQALVEGGADYVASLVTARMPDPERDAWARSREAWVWDEFRRDAAVVRAGTDAKGAFSPAAQQAFSRWFANAGNAPEGWPGELGYWVGMRISESYVARAADRHAAIDRLLDPADPARIVRESSYSGAP